LSTLGTMEPMLIEGALAVDDRGSVSFVNEFDLEPVRRFYVVTNHQIGFVRAWHAHRNERKFVTVVQGSALVCCVRIDDWTEPSTELPVSRYVLSSRTPSVLAIPGGYANGFMSLEEGTGVLFFSSALVEESAEDDIRFPARHWDPWHVEER
jgi:dTDP-4-dehydrorhamnose 3,5-epimerase-like enzyme